MAKFYWLTSPYQGDVNNIEIDPSNRDAKEDKLREKALWFYDDEKEEAEQFLLEVKAFLRNLYCSKYHHADRVPWMDESWEKGRKKPQQ